MLSTSTDDFRRALDAAFARTGPTVRRTIAAFSVDIAQDAWAAETDFVASFPAVHDSRRSVDFRIAIVGSADPTLGALVPEPSSSSHLHADDAIYALWIPEPHAVLFVYDFIERRGLMWLAKGKTSHWLLCRPFLPVIHAHASITAWVPLHASAAGLDGRFLLFAGASGAGKSTAALACACSGWHYAGDDVVLVDPSTRTVLPLFASARLRKAGMAPFASVIARSTFAESDENDDPRYELRLERDRSIYRPGGGAVKAVVMPRRRGRSAFDFSRAKPFDVFAAVMPVTVSLLPGLQAVTMPKLFAASAMVPAFTVDTGADPLAIPAAMADFLTTL